MRWRQLSNISQLTEGAEGSLNIVYSGKWSKGGKQSKYKNKRFNTREGWFDSKSEWHRWVFLKGRLKAGEIYDLKRQVKFSIDINDQHICEYIADSTYYTKSGKYVVEDYKGVILDLFKLKAKLVKALHGIEVKIVRKIDEPIEG